MDWERLRADLPVTGRWAFLDNAAVAPLSGRARRAIVDYADDMAGNGVISSPRWLKRIEEVRGLAARLLNADPTEIAFVPSTSAGIGLVAEGLDWHSGDNIVTAAEEYPANLYPWMNLAARGVETRRIASRGPRIAIDDIRAALDARTRLVSLSSVEYASGFRNDIDAIGQLCRERGILFFVDAIQSLGVLPLDVQASPIDFLAADGHKWLLGPEGAGIFYIRREHIDRLHPVGVGWHSVVNCFDFGNTNFHLRPDAARWEGGSPNAAGITALGASLELLLEISVPAIEKRALELTDHLCQQAAKAGLTVFSSRQGNDWSSIVSIVPPAGADGMAVVRRCRDAGVVINCRAGRLRVSPHCYNTSAEIDRVIDLLKT
jgi:selenocysteine lyase/cysteine desulfurase